MRISQRVPKITKLLPSIMAAIAAFLVVIGSARADDQATGAATPLGEWLVSKQLARIKIVDCDGRLWGVVSWEQHPGIDSKNPDPLAFTAHLGDADPAWNDPKQGRPMGRTNL